MKPAQSRLILSGLLACALLPPVFSWRDRATSSAHRSFVLPPPPLALETAPYFQAELITPEPEVPSAHVASICETPNGTLCAAWYGGTHEGARDVCIYWSNRGISAGEKWSKPAKLVSREMAERELRRPIKKIGNGLLFADGAGQLRLLYVTVSIGGWSGSSLNMKGSPDGGQTWLPSRRLTLSPFFNVSELVKNNACALSDGTWAIPIYHECLGKFPEILWLKEDAAGDLTWRKTRIWGGRSALQPALVPLDEQTAVAVCRDCSPARSIRISRSIERGETWTEPRPIQLPNSDSGLDALLLSDGRILLAFNDTRTGRENLRLALSDNTGMTWRRSATSVEALA